MTWDSNLQLSLAFVGNSLLLILGASLFFAHASEISAFSQMYNALQDSIIAGAIASSTLSTLFALALLASGQNSTITGTLTGQIVMEGFLHMKLSQWMIRIGTRIFDLLPVIIVAVLFGHQEKTLDQLLVYSQVFLSIALPFSIFPLIYLTSKKSVMGEFTNVKWNTILGYVVSIILTIPNVKLLFDIFLNLFKSGLGISLKIDKRNNSSGWFIKIRNKKEQPKLSFYHYLRAYFKYIYILYSV